MAVLLDELEVGPLDRSVVELDHKLPVPRPGLVGLPHVGVAGRWASYVRPLELALTDCSMASMGSVESQAIVPLLGKLDPSAALAKMSRP